MKTQLKAESFDRKFDDGDDTIAQLDLSTTWFLSILLILN